ncbi:hypothetical protein MVEN_00978100 [Mycena venus]|uniref:F-box domain-containing protein n=1 Tax=Mycena venus TaxID=2733690 RepID=A0A8H6YEA1_9AGAR|nr:hypothetical protein MVEN_00978100 [Mycena venus]
MYAGNWQDNSSLCRTVSKNVLDLQRIEELVVDELDRVAIEHLSQLSTLKYLRLATPHLQHSLLLPHSSSLVDPAFPALRAVDFDETTVDIVIHFLELLSKCGLIRLCVGIMVPATTFATGQLYSSLRSHLSHSALQTLRVDVAENHEMFTPPATMIAHYVINRDVLATLFCFTNLTEVSLSPPVGFDIDDATAWDLARAWPRLTSLYLGTATELQYPSSMTLGGLRAFATHCKDLNNLVIAFNASTVPPIDNSSIISQSSLILLDTNKSPINDPVAVARFISALFPNLAIIHTYLDWIIEQPAGEDEDDEAAQARLLSARWKEVESKLPGKQKWFFV